MQHFLDHFDVADIEALEHNLHVARGEFGHINDVEQALKMIATIVVHIDALTERYKRVMNAQYPQENIHLAAFHMTASGKLVSLADARSIFSRYREELVFGKNPSCNEANGTLVLNRANHPPRRGPGSDRHVP